MPRAKASSTGSWKPDEEPLREDGGDNAGRSGPGVGQPENDLIASIDPETQLSLADLHTVAQSVWWVVNSKTLPSDADSRNERWQDDYPVWIKTTREILRHLKNNGLKVVR